MALFSKHHAAKEPQDKLAYTSQYNFYYESIYLKALTTNLSLTCNALNKFLILLYTVAYVNACLKSCNLTLFFMVMLKKFIVFSLTHRLTYLSVV